MYIDYQEDFCKFMDLLKFDHFKKKLTFSKFLKKIISFKKIFDIF